MGYRLAADQGHAGKQSKIGVTLAIMYLEAPGSFRTSLRLTRASSLPTHKVTNRPGTSSIS